MSNIRAVIRAEVERRHKDASGINAMERWDNLLHFIDSLPTEPFIDVVFDGPPSHEAGRFVEVEDSTGHSVNVGEWLDRGDGMWALRIPLEATTLPSEDPPAATDSVSPGVAKAMARFEAKRLELAGHHRLNAQTHVTANGTQLLMWNDGTANASSADGTRGWSLPMAFFTIDGEHWSFAYEDGVGKWTQHNDDGEPV